MTMQEDVANMGTMTQPQSTKRWITVEELLALSANDQPIFLCLDVESDVVGPHEFKGYYPLEDKAVIGLLSEHFLLVRDLPFLYPDLMSFAGIVASMFEVQSGSQLGIFLTKDFKALGVLPAFLGAHDESVRVKGVLEFIREMVACLHDPGSTRDRRARHILADLALDEMSDELSCPVLCDPSVWEPNDMDEDSLVGKLRAATATMKSAPEQSLTAVMRDGFALLDPRKGGIRPSYAHMKPSSPFSLLCQMGLCLTPAEQAADTVSANLASVVAGPLYDLKRGGVYTGASFATHTPSGIKLLHHQTQLLELLLDMSLIRDKDTYLSLASDVISTCNEQFLNPQTGLYEETQLFGKDTSSSGLFASEERLGDLGEAERNLLQQTTTIRTVPMAKGAVSITLRNARVTTSELASIRAILAKLVVEADRGIIRTALGRSSIGSNALAVKAMLKSSLVLNDKQLAELALSVIEVIWAVFEKAPSALPVSIVRGESKGIATVYSYGPLADALIYCYEVTANTTYLERARAVHRACVEKFWDSTIEMFIVSSLMERLTGMKLTSCPGLYSGIAAVYRSHTYFLELDGESSDSFVTQAYERQYLRIFNKNATDEYVSLIMFFVRYYARRERVVLYRYSDKARQDRHIRACLLAPWWKERDVFSVNDESELALLRGMVGEAELEPDHAYVIRSDGSVAVAVDL